MSLNGQLFTLLHVGSYAVLMYLVPNNYDVCMQYKTNCHFFGLITVDDLLSN